MSEKFMEDQNGVYYNQKDNSLWLLEDREVVQFIDKDSFKIRTTTQYRVTGGRLDSAKGCVLYNKNLIYIGAFK